MFAGHVGTALAIGRVERRINVATFIFASMLLDLLLWAFVLLGWESASIPADFARSHQAHFVFPYSHGLVGSLVWSALAALVVYLLFPRLVTKRAVAAALVAAAAFSHLILDALVHEPELPLVRADSPKVGLGLWNTMFLALSAEALIVAFGLWLYLSVARISPDRRFGLCGLCALCVEIPAFTVVGLTVAPAPPSITTMAVSSLITIGVVRAITAWVGRTTGNR